jgi:hypothetical protein
MDAITSSSSPVTIQRLRNLRPGAKMVIYRGDFDLDLSHPGAPQYKKLLRRVYETMRQFEREGRIILRIEPEAIEEPPSKSGRPGKIVVFKRYTAVGI